MLQRILLLVVFAVGCGAGTAPPADQETAVEPSPVSETATQEVASPSETSGENSQEELTVELMREVKRLLKLGDSEALAARVVDGESLIIDFCSDRCGDLCPTTAYAGPGPAGECTERTVLRSQEAFRAWLDEAVEGWAPRNCAEDAPQDRAANCRYYAGFSIQGRMGCEDRCCRITREYGPHEYLQLESICFAPTDAGTLRLSSIHLVEQ